MRLSLPLLCLLLLASCSKSSHPAGSPPPADSTTNSNTPLPNTVESTDTLQVMAYNVLSYGDGCQGPPDSLNGYLKTIISYVQPDLFSLEKINSFQLGPNDAYNLAGNITDSVLNVLFPSRYAYAQPTNSSGGSDMSVLFYNQQKLSFSSERTLVSYITDFDLYKLYYNDPNLSITKDTTFLYVVVNHTQSGSSSTDRDAQLTQEMQAARSLFSYFPNLINMGDFNFRNSLEAGYQAIVSSTDSNTQLYDCPFSPDNVLQYPANWDNNPAPYSAWLTTTTRQSATIPDSCGTSGGAKSWYDHIFISPWLISGINYMKYLPGSYRTIGNDGQRLGVSVNSPNPVINTSTPSDVINALFQFSDKYPVTIKVVVQANRTGNSPANP